MKRPEERLADPVRRLRRRGGHRRHDFLGTGVRGSKAYAKQYAEAIEELVLLDFVANKHLSIPYEAELRRGDVGATWRARPAVGSDSAFPARRAGQVRTTTRRSCSAASPRST